MIVRVALIGLGLFAAPALAGPSVSATHVEAGGPSGKMAHRSYRPIAAASDCAAKPMHTIPAGKIHHFTAASRGQGCATSEAALIPARGTAPGVSATARD